MKDRPFSRRLGPMVSVSQLITPPTGAAYSPSPVQTTGVLGSEVHVPVRAPVESSMMSPDGSTVIVTSLGIWALMSFQNVCTEATAVVVSRKYIVVTPGPPTKPVHADLRR